MTLSVEQAQALVIEFCATYPVAATIGYKIRDTQEELYGPQATREAAGTILGSFHPRGRRALFAASNFDTDEKFRRSLRHEILGHFGINTFSPAEKRAVLETIVAARSASDLHPLWKEVDRLYSNISDMRKAEEVFAFACERIHPTTRADVTSGLRSFQETCIARTRAMQLIDLINVTAMVAEGLHDRSRSQQNFPASDSAQFKQDFPMKTSEYPVWLAVPPDDRDKVRAAVGQLSDGRAAVVWDREAKLWYARPGCDLERIQEWLPDRSRRAGGGDPEAEFLDVLTQAGLIVKGMPVMDGTRQRVATVDDKHGKQSGVYCGFLDRRPGGWFINYHRAESAKDVTNWSATGGESDPVTSLHIRAAARQSQDDVGRERAAVQAAAAAAAKQLYDRLPAADPAHPYLVRKGIPPTPEIRQTRNGALVVPFFNAEGIFKTLQYIPPEGEKYLFENAPKQEHFLVVGGLLDPASPILYAEGYATARSLNLATDLPVVMTIDAGNMVAVAKVLHQQYPDTRHLFMADFDHAKDVNKGLIMATEAADLVGGQVLYPAFSADEIVQGYTDFNDLHQSRGLEAVREQTFSLIQPHDEVRLMATDSNSQAPNAALQATAEPDIQSVRSEQALAEDPDSQGADAEASIPVLAQGQLASYVDDYTRDARALTNRLGLTPLIEALYGQGKTTDEIAKTVGSALGNSVVLQERGTFINKIAETLGVPGRGPHDAGAAAFAQWQQQRGQPSQTGAYDLRADSPSELVRREVAWRKNNNTYLSDHDVRGSATMMQMRGEDHARWSLITNDSTPEGSAMLHAYMENGAYRNAFKRTLERLYVRYQDSPETIKTLDASTAHAVEMVRAVELRLLGEASTGATDLVEGQLLDPASSADDKGQVAPAYGQALASIDVPAPASDVTPDVVPAATPEVQPGPATVEERAAAVIEPEVPAVAVQPAVVDVPAPAPASQPSDTGSVIDAARAEAAGELPSMAVEIPEKAPSSPVPPATVAADQVETAEAIAEVTPEARPAMAFAGPRVEDDTPVSSHEQEERPLPPRLAPLDGDVAVESPAFDGIVVGAPIGRDEPAQQASQIDKDALLARITREVQGDNSVLYKLDAEPAFVDRGSRLEMVPGTSQSDEKVMAALLTAAQWYRGKIELTGSEAFKTKAISLIAQHRINVTMKNPAQQMMLDEARKVLNVQAGVPDAIHGDTPPAFDASPAPYVPMDDAPAPTAHTMPSTASPVSVQPLAPDVEPAPVVPVVHAAPVVPAVPRIDPALHQSHTAAKEGVTGKVLQCGKAPFRFEEGNTESAFIKMRTKQGVQTFWGRELAGLVRETRIEPGKMATLKWLKSEDVVIKKPIKDGQGMTVGFEDFKTHRNQWSLTPLNGPSVLTGNDEGVKLAAYDAARFAMIQNSVMAQLKLQMDPPAAPKDGLFWMTPNGQGSAKAGDELSVPRPELDKDNAGRQVMSSWSEDGCLDMALFRGDGPYLQGVVRQGDEYQHVLVSLPGHGEAPPMVFNAITAQGLVPIGVGNGINRSGGEPVQRDHVAYRLEGDTATRIGKLDNPADVPPALHHRLGFDERWKDDNSLPKSKPAAAPSMQPSEMRPS